MVLSPTCAVAAETWRACAARLVGPSSVGRHGLYLIYTSFSLVAWAHLGPSIFFLTFFCLCRVKGGINGLISISTSFWHFCWAVDHHQPHLPASTTGLGWLDYTVGHSPENATLYHWCPQRDDRYDFWKHEYCSDWAKSSMGNVRSSECYISWI